MQNDYEILGLSVGANQNEIKRAYFKLVRKFSPEKDPEHFQEIRGAYERLMQTSDTDAELSLEMPTDPDAKDTVVEIERMMHLKEFKKASSIAENAIKTFGEYEVFLYLLAYSQRIDGHSGKAVKNFEKLVKQYPDKKVYKRYLALAYYERGFGKKAFAAFGEAYKVGVKDADFILEFSRCCNERAEFDTGIEILLELVNNFDSTAKAKERIEEYVEAYMGMFSMCFFIGNTNFKEIANSYIDFIKKTGRLLKKLDENIFDIALLIIVSISDIEYIPYVEEILKQTERFFPKEKYNMKWTVLSSRFMSCKIQCDSRLSQEIEWCWDAFTPIPALQDSVYIRFLQTDCKLLLIERMPEIKKELEVIKNEYPELYKEMESFLKQLEQEDILYIKQKLLKNYNRMEKYMDEGHYYELYPDKRPEKLQWNSMENGSFIRSKKKVGRNDPCPCGSGKKYKHCCGRNNN